MTAKADAFDVGDYVVYPKHGVGRVIELQNEEIAGMQLELYVLRFEKERMTLRVPVNKVESIGMRKLSSDKTLKEALDTLTQKPRVKRTMWSRRAQEYEAKINSGDLVSIAEVTRDLFRADDQPEQSYSERQIFEAASSRLARELAAMEKTDEKAALGKILVILNENAPQILRERRNRVKARVGSQERPSLPGAAFLHRPAESFMAMSGQSWHHPLMTRAALLPLVCMSLLSGCVSTVASIVTAPIKIAGKAADMATTSQSEADEKRGRQMRKQEENIGKLERSYSRNAQKCREGDVDACDRAEAEYEQLGELVDVRRREY